MMDPNPLTYPKSKPGFNHALFSNPTAEYRGSPLWSWNCKLDKGQLLRQIEQLKQMGMGGFHIHSRVGLDTEYLGEEFMELVRDCVNKAEEMQMLACLYDEDRWPSGCAGGRVVMGKPEFKAQHILLTPNPYGSIKIERKSPGSTAQAIRSEEGSLLAEFDILLNDNGELLSSRKLRHDETGKNIWYAYLEPNPSSPWFNGETYVNTFSKPAIAQFISLTHEVYKSKVGDKFHTVIPTIFTDEPQFAHKTQLTNGKARSDIFLPWSPDLGETFKGQYDYEIVEKIPEIVWDLPGRAPSLARYHYHDHICERFVTAFMDQLAEWCRGNRIALTGHMMKEPCLFTQTSALGEAMRCYRSLDLPGIDILCDRREYNTAKQAASVARQNGARGVMSEIYGVTGWTFDFEGHKGCGDWQAALGITFRVHHLSWVSMAGEAKRDYPAAIGYQSPWYKEYKYIEDYFSRLNVALTVGTPVTRVGVIHPIESYWLCYGPVEAGYYEQDFREQAFTDLTKWLLFNLIDFDFISESLLPIQVGKIGSTLQVGQCTYDAIVIPNLRTIRSTTLKILRGLAGLGGRVIVAGEAPSLIDASLPITPPTIDGCSIISWSKHTILHELNEFRDIRIINTDGTPTDKLLYQMRQDGDKRLLFVCNTDRKAEVITRVELKGLWKVVVLDPLGGGEETEIGTYTNSGAWTIIDYEFEGCSSALFELFPGTGSSTKPGQRVLSHEFMTHSEATLETVRLSEPNVLLLDYAEFKVDGEAWEQKEEILRIDNIVRERLGLPLKLEAFRQPWSITQEQRKPKAHLSLRFTFESFLDIGDIVELALEDAESILIEVNGAKVDQTTPKSWWVDESIKTVPLLAGSIRKGPNEIKLSMDFHLLTNLERVYLLGSFAVDMRGRECKLQPLDLGTIRFGDITFQGLPFYAGNITYQTTITVPGLKGDDAAPTGTPIVLEVPRFHAPVVAVSLDGKRVGLVAFEPHLLYLGELDPGPHRVDIESFGNRHNAFGAVHLPDGITKWCGPNSQRGECLWWTGEYNLVPMGVLQAPRVKVKGKQALRIPYLKDRDTW